MQVSIPVPKVPSPPISAPPAASDWGQFFPPKHDPEADENEFYEKMEHVIEGKPKSILDPFWASVKAINKVIFRSTPPNGPQPHHEGSWTFSALGDYGGGHSPQDEIAQNVLKGKPDLLLTLGDNVYFNGTEEEFAKKWDPPKWFGKLREEIPVMPSMGNHDVRREPDGVPYFKRFPELKNNRFYSYDHKGVHFVAVDTTEALEPGSPQLKWLEKDLAASNADWKVLYYHHPLLPGQLGMKSPNLGYLSPLLAKYGVDLLLTGHEHNYQRSKPMNAGGTIEVLAGGGGESLHPFLTKQPAHNAYRDVDFGHVEVEVTGDELIGRYVVRDGSVRDTWVIKNNTPGTKAPVVVDQAAGQVVEAPAAPAAPATV